MLDVNTLVSSDTVFLSRFGSFEKGPVDTGLMMTINIGRLRQELQGPFGNP